jgi:hypothetical protein
MSDAELNKAALLIAKLLIRTREGKIQWERVSDSVSNFLSSPGSFKARLDDGLEAHLVCDDKEVAFKLCGPPAVDLPSQSPVSAMLGIRENNEIISISLSDSYRKTDMETPESIVYRDLAELIFLAGNPKSVSDDLRYQQALTFLDKLSA